MNGFCDKCFNVGIIERHHKLSNSKKNREVYGKLLDLPFNIQNLCYDCHHQKPVDKYTEKRFREIAESLGYSLPLGTKSYQRKWGNQ